MSSNARMPIGKALVCLLLGASPALASTYDWASITSGGIATIPSGAMATIGDADDVAAVEALTGIVFADETASVQYTASTALNLRASLFGEGTFSASVSGTLVLWGDNSALVSPGHFSAYNSPVVVSNHFGLGSAASGAAEFTYNSRSSLKFGSPSRAFTNEVAMTFTLESGAWPSIGSATAAEKLVLSNDLCFVGSSRTFKFKNNCEMIAGKIYGTSGFFYNAQDGNNVNIRYSGTSYLYSPDWLWLGGNATTTYYLFSETQASAPRVIPGQGGAGPTVVFGRTNVFDTARNPVMDICKNAKWDLNGYDQQFGDIAVQYFGSTINEANTDYTTVRSASPAVLKSTACVTDRNYPIKFEGCAGWCYDCARTNSLVNVISTSSGTLDVAKGRIIMKWNAGWSGDARVRSGAELEIASPYGMSGGAGELVVEDGGKLILGDNAGVTVCRLVFGEDVIESSGTYTVAALKAAGYNVEGPDSTSITVMESYDVPWNGWLGAVGGTVKVPTGTTVFIYDEDVPAVSALSAIKIGPSSRVICSNVTTRLVLSAAVSGYGSFEAYDSAGLELAGDNSALATPGGFFFTNSLVEVSGAHGLGSSGTAAAHIWLKSASDAFVFSGSGLTNDVPITLHTYNCGNTWAQIGGANVGDVFVQNADFLVTDMYRSERHVKFTSEAHFKTGYFGWVTRSGTMHLSAANSGVGIYLEGDVVPRAEMLYEEGGTLHIDCSMDVVTFMPYANTRTVCEGENTTTYARHGSFPGSILDLNGYNQSLARFADQYDKSHSGYVVTSAVPATVSVVGALNTSDKAYGVFFRGKAGLKFDTANVTNTIDKTFSDTVASLEVARGALGFSNGAGWGGKSVTIRSGAALVVAATSAASAFTAPGESRSRADLVIENGGTLYIESGTVNVRSCMFNGTRLGAGVYDEASGVGVAGGGQLSVRSSGDGFSVIFR